MTKKEKEKIKLLVAAAEKAHCELEDYHLMLYEKLEDKIKEGEEVREVAYYGYAFINLEIVCEELHIYTKTCKELI